MSSSTLARRQQDKLLERIKDLRKLKENRKCFECHSKSPSCVDTTHNTFVCMTCGGILRMFNFRVKSISISSFSISEVQGLEDGGNRVARKQWLTRFPKDENMPTPGNADQIKEHIRRKYEENRWARKPSKDKSSKRRGSSKSSKKRAQTESQSDDSVEEEEVVSRSKSKTKSSERHKNAPASSPGRLRKSADDLLDLNAMFSNTTVSNAAPSNDMWGFAAHSQAHATDSMQTPPPMSAPPSMAWNTGQADMTGCAPSVGQWNPQGFSQDPSLPDMPVHTQHAPQSQPQSHQQLEAQSEHEDPFAHLSLGGAPADNPFAQGDPPCSANDSSNPFFMEGKADSYNPFDVGSSAGPELQGQPAFHPVSHYHSAQDLALRQQQQQQQQQQMYVVQQQQQMPQPQQVMYSQQYQSPMVAAQGYGYAQQGYDYAQPAQGYGYLPTTTVAATDPSHQVPSQVATSGAGFPVSDDSTNPFL